jgi:hypothetical protein
VANIEEFFFASRFENVVDNGGEVLGGTFVKAEAPELRTLTTCVEGGMVLGVRVASGVHHPNVIAFGKYYERC